MRKAVCATLLIAAMAAFPWVVDDECFRAFEELFWRRHRTGRV